MRSTADSSFEPLAPEDLEILRLESPTVAGHTLKVSIVEEDARGRVVDADALRRRLAERIERAPVLRRRLQVGRRGRATGWSDDPAFDVAEHVRERRAPEPVSYDELRACCAEMMQERLDRSRPLWAIDIVSPLRGGGAAVVWRLHHSVADGAAAMHLARTLLWDATDHPDPDRGCAGVSRTPARLHSVREAIEVRRPGRLPGALRRELARTRHPSPLDGAIGATRAVAFTSLPLGALKRATKALVPEATVNDALLALVAGALRRHAHAHGAEPLDARVRVPVCLHRHREGGHVANRASFYAVDLPLDEPHPTRRLQRITAQTAACKRGRDAVVLDTLMRDAGRVAPPLRDVLSRMTLSPRTFALAVSNVVGPVQRPTILGSPVRALYSVVEIGERHALRVAATSMSDELHVGLCADPAIAGDPQVLATGMAAEAAALCAA